MNFSGVEVRHFFLKRYTIDLLALHVNIFIYVYIFVFIYNHVILVIYI